MNRHKLAALFLLSLFCLQGAYLVHCYSTTYDEHAHVSAGYLYWKTGHFQGGWNNPPFLQLCLALPYAAGLCGYSPLDAAPPYAARIVNLLLGLLLGMVLYCLALSIAGEDGALLALFCYCLSPSFVAHSSLATTDIGVTLFSLLFVYLLRMAHIRRSAPVSACAGAALGLALCSKFSALLVLVVVPYLLYLPSAVYERTWKPVLAEALLLVVFAWLSFCAVYRFEGCFTVKSPLPDWPAVRALTFAVPSQAVNGILNKFAEGRSGCWTYLLGRHSPAGFIHYYPLVWLLKTMPGTLLLFAALLIETRRGRLSLWGSAPYLWLPAMAVLIGHILFNRAQTGVRHIFIFTLLVYCALAVLVRHRWPRRRETIAVAVGLNVMAALWVFPCSLSYVNFAGELLSPGQFALTGPDVDWGQDESFLGRALDKLPGKEKIRVLPLPPHVPECGYIAVSANALLRKSLKPGRPNYDWLKIFTPLEKAGGSWLIYHLSEKRLESLADDKDFARVEIWLRYLFYHGRYSRLEKICAVKGDENPRAWYYRARALVLAGEFDAALSDFNRLEGRYGQLKSNARLWKILATDLVAWRQRPDERLPRLAHALSLLFMLERDLSSPLRERLSAVDGLKGPFTPKTSSREIRLFWALRLVERHNWEKALPLLESLRGAEADRPVVEFYYQRCRQFATLRADRDIDAQIALARLYEALGCPSMGLDLLKRLHRERPFHYEIIRQIHLFLGNQKLGAFHLDSGLGTFLDRRES